MQISGSALLAPYIIALTPAAYLSRGFKYIIHFKIYTLLTKFSTVKWTLCYFK